MKAFENAANEEGIDVCDISYPADLKDISETFKLLTTPSCGCTVCRCRINVAFGQPEALISLFKQAHDQKYEGQWLVGESEFGSFDDVVRNLTNHSVQNLTSHSREDGDDHLHKILRGILKAQ